MRREPRAGHVLVHDPDHGQDIVTLGLVKELAYTGRRLPAPKALAWGLVDELVHDFGESVITV